MRSRLCAFSMVASLAAAATTATGGASAQASPTPAPAVTVTGSISQLAASGGAVVVQVEIPDPSQGSGVLQDVTVATQQLSSAGGFSVAVPSSPVLTNAGASGNGLVNFVVIIYTGTMETLQNVPVALSTSAAPGNIDVANEVAAGRVALSPFPTLKPIPAGQLRQLTAHGGIAGIGRSGFVVPPPCQWTPIGPLMEKAAHLGQMHLNSSGMTLKWDYVTQGDTSMSVGYSNSQFTGFSLNGTVGSNRSFSGNGSFTDSGPHFNYVDGHIYVQEYSGTHCASYYKVQLDHAVGDSWNDSTLAPVNPYGGCNPNDPNGWATVEVNGAFGSDRAMGEWESASVSLFGIDFGTTSGYSNDIHHTYNNGTQARQYVCGNQPMPNSRIIYSGAN